MYDLHGTELNFVHKRILRGAAAFLTGGPIAGTAAFLSGGGGRGQQRTGPCPPTPGFTVQRGKDGVCRKNVRKGVWEVVQEGLGLASSGQCRFPLRWDPISRSCKAFVGLQPGSEPGGIGGGDAVMGQYGAALTPDVDNVMTLRCLPGMILGKDQLCYNKSDLSNKERRWPKGTRPLGTPGEMACLRKAASFGRRMETTVKRMQKIGVLSKPARVKRTPMPRARQITPGPSIINVE